TIVSNACFNHKFRTTAYRCQLEEKQVTKDEHPGWMLAGVLMGRGDEVNKLWIVGGYRMGGREKLKRPARGRFRYALRASVTKPSCTFLVLFSFSSLSLLLLPLRLSLCFIALNC